ncbi:GDP-fructose:GMP antiporter, putative [Hepatocystis sp. ex Piliocolobus tephrosceles]|nr:GDP-fructose:GMP antiporter, putative [Hepatocystis sp. ex Piliocolobus tephrosceles]
MKKNRFRVFSSIAIYLISSIAAVFANKHVLMNSSFGLVLLILLQHLSCLIFLFLFKNVLKNFEKKTDSDNENVQDIPFSFFHGIKQLWLIILTYNFTIIFGNICLKYTNISSFQLSRSMTLPLNFLFSYFFFKQIQFNFLMICSCIIVSIGFFIFSINAVSINYYSVLYGVIASIVQATHLNLLKSKLMIYKNKRMLLEYNLMYSIIILFIYSLITKDIFEIYKLNGQLIYSITISCLASVGVTFSSFLCIYYTDNVIFNMFGNLSENVKSCVRPPLKVNTVDKNVKSEGGKENKGYDIQTSKEENNKDAPIYIFEQMVKNY